MTVEDRSAGPSDITISVADGTAARLRGEGVVEVSARGRRHVTDARVLRVLELFAAPMSLKDAHERLRAAGPEAFIHASSLIVRLRDEGILVDVALEAPRVARGFDSPWVHVAMLDDDARARAFIRAIRATVRPGDVVADIGTGTGVLAVEAARAGAKRVYAIEERTIADGAERVFAENGVADRIVTVRGRSTAIELPERPDVLVSEILGNDPLAEGIISTFRDARRRLLKPDARFIPRGLDIFALPVDLPDEYLDAHTFTEANVARWRAALGIDFRAMTAFASEVVNLPNVKPQDVTGWPVVADPVRLTHLDFRLDDDAALTTSTSFVARVPTRCLGLLLYFEIDLAEAISLSTAPRAAATNNSWSCCVFRAGRRPIVAAGDTVRIDFGGAAGATVLRVT